MVGGVGGPAGDVYFDTEGTFPEALEFLYKQNFTGRVTLHFCNGTPRILEYGTPNRITLTQAPQTPPQQKVLDKTSTPTDTPT